MSKTYEFALSEETPEAVSETELDRAQADWNRRSDAAAEKVNVPPAPYRVRGDSKAGAWFVEAAKVERSDMPQIPFYASWAAYMPTVDATGRMSFRRPKIDYSDHIADLNADKPKAKLKWTRIGRRRRGWQTYAKALRWLRAHLEPIRDESVYFTPDGRDAV